MAAVKNLILWLSIAGFYSVRGLDRLSLNGAWTAVNSNQSIVVPAQVPGSIYTDLVRAGILGDPYYGFHDTEYRWVSYDDWTFSRSFPVSTAMLSYSTVRLVVEGLDTVAQIKINDVYLGLNNNMFVRYDIDVKDKLKVGLNSISVSFTSPVKYGAMQAAQYPYTVPPVCSTPETHGECNVNFIRKEACSFSWDWGPAFPTMGIWKNISLEAYNSASIGYITVATKRDSGDQWQVSGSVFIDAEGASPSTSVTGHLLVQIPGVASETTPVSFRNKQEKVTFSIPVTKEVEMWWPNGFGGQALYDLDLTFTSSDGQEVVKKSVRFGFRMVDLIQDPVGGNSEGLTFYFRINGLPIFMRGSNWIPADSFQERITEEYLRKLLGSARIANMNMLRVWGGGVYESDMFYAIADEYGIMIWQDFMFACSMYPTSEDFLQNVQNEVTQQVRRLSHHPSIAVWAGNNENEAALRQNWYETNKNFSLYYKDYIKLDIDTIRTTVLVEDTSRPFVASSPSNGLETAQEGWVAKNPYSTLYGDIHYYDYASDLWNWQAFPVPRFASEYGFQSWASLETLAKVSEPSDWGVNSSFAFHRQHHGSGNAELLLALSYHWTLPSAEPMGQWKFSDFVYLTQVYQAMAMKTETEVYRRHQYGDGPTMGALYWQLNDIWQAPTWASIEYGGKWKMLHYYARRFFNHTLISPYLDGDQITVYYVEDRHPERTADHFNHQFRSENLRFPNQGDHKSKQKNSFENDVWKSDGSKATNSIFSHQDQLVLTVVCYSWAKLNPLKVWNVPFVRPSQTSGLAFNSSLSSALQDAGCPSANHCFLHFSLGGDIYGPTNVLLLSNFTTAVGLSSAKLTITKVSQLETREFQIELSTDQVALFVWLEATGVPGYFSDNGFFMVQSTMTIKFHAWSDYKGNVEHFTQSLSVMSMMDIYHESTASL